MSEPIVEPVVAVTEPVTVTDGTSAPVTEPKAAAPTANPLLEKALKEKRNAMDRVRSLEAEKQTMVDEQLKKSEDFKTLYEASQTKLTTLEERLENEQVEKETGFKASALKKELLKMGADDKGADFLLGAADMKTLKYDNEHKIVLGVEDMAKTLNEAAPSMFGGSNVKTDSSAPSNNFADVTLEGFKNLTPEQRKDPKILEKIYADKGIKLRR